tara:strand:+ start:224 stop:1600 length:1377 start_codon:yes stop_codon:yes gene_type:complete
MGGSAVGSTRDTRESLLSEPEDPAHRGKRSCCARIRDCCSCLGRATILPRYPSYNQEERRWYRPFVGCRSGIYQTFADPSYSPLSKLVSIFVLLCVLVSIATIIIRQEPFAHHEPQKSILRWTEVVCVLVFTVEYVIRLFTCPHLCRFLFTFFSFIDIASVLPFWVTFLFPTEVDLSFLRTLRLLRVFRIFETGRFSVCAEIYAGTFAHSARHLYLLVFVVALIVVIISSAVNLLEWSGAKPSAELLDDFGRTDELQRICFGTILNSFWWTIVTITTVGYGECTPVTAPGKVLGALTTLIGPICLSMPIAIIGNSFVRMVEVFDAEHAQHITTMTKLDVREFVWALRQKDGLRDDQPDGALHVDALMRAFDADHDGVLQADEVERLKERCCRDLQPARASGAADHGGGADATAKLLAAQSDQIALLHVHLERQDERMARLERMLEQAVAPRGGEPGGS